MEKIIITVECADKNLSAYIDDLPGCVAVGKTLDEIERNMKEAIEGHIEISAEYGDEIPEVFKGEYELVFKFDTQGLLNYYSGIFTKAALSRITGINERQLWHYAAGVRKPRKEQIKRIETGLHKLGSQLLSVEL